MKKVYSLIVMCFLVTVNYAQVQSDCASTSELEYHYQYDVADLALNRLFAINSPDKNQITIPQVHLDSVWNGLSAIFNASSIPQRDSIFDIYCIHNNSNITTMLWPHIYVVLDTSVNWTKHWLNGEIVTGYPELDELISAYDYYIFSTVPNYASVVLYSEAIVNSFALSDSLATFNGIESAGPYPVTVDGNKIQYSADGDHQFFNFTRAWEDCMSGCIYKHQWKFKVHYSDCTVEYLGLESNASNNLPDPVHCNITSIIHPEMIPNAISVFPNPSKNKISIQGEGILKIDLLNGLGQFIASTKPNGNLATFEIEALKPGLYFLKIGLEGQSIHKRFIKE